ncbi:MAG: ATP synthase F1 subunit epsilon [Parcubacteria group bacterium]|nr:ATP synthase F1 subunit epsilon [Parcubacteria group bacterium]
MFQLSVLTLHGELFRGTIDSLIVPAVDGEIGVLTGHIPLITALKKGELRYREGGTEHRIAIERGFLEVRPDAVVLLIDTEETRDGKGVGA